MCIRDSTVRGQKASDDKNERNYLYQGIATRTFERKFQLADHVEVTSADLANGMLTVSLVKEIPEAMKPKRIAIGGGTTIDHQVTEEKEIAA